MIELRSSYHNNNKLLIIRKKEKDSIGDLVCNIINGEHHTYCNFMKSSVTLEDLNNITRLLNEQETLKKTTEHSNGNCD